MTDSPIFLPADDADSEPFVPSAKYALGRSSKALACLLLVAVGFLGGVGVSHAFNSGSARSNKGNFQTIDGGTGAYSGHSGNGSGSGTGSGRGAGSGTLSGHGGN